MNIYRVIINIKSFFGDLKTHICCFKCNLYCSFTIQLQVRVRNLKFARILKFATSKTLVNFMKKMMFLSQNWYFSVQKALLYYTFNKSHHSSFILLVFSCVANFRYVANFRFLTLYSSNFAKICFYYPLDLTKCK